jgi:O-antigen/teichoic acid export membrane protein
LNVKVVFVLFAANLFAFGKQLMYAFFVTPSQLAIWALCFFMYALFSAYGSFGFSALATRNMALEIAQGHKVSSNRWAKVVFIIYSFMMFPFIFCVYLFLKGGAYDTLENLWLILFFVLSNGFFTVAMYEIQLTNPYNFGRVLLGKSLITITIGYLVIQHFGVPGVIYVEGIVSIACGFWFVRLWFLKIKFDSTLMSSPTIWESLKFLIISFFSSIQLQIDKFYSIKLLSQVEFGALNFGLLINTIAQQFQYACTVILIPRVSKMIVEKRVAELHLRILALMIVSTLTFLLLAFILRPLISYLVEFYYPDYTSVLSIYWGIVFLSIMRATEFGSIIYTYNKQTNLIILLSGSLASSAIVIYLIALVFKQNVSLIDFNDVYIAQAGMHAIIASTLLIFSYHKAKAGIKKENTNGKD